MLAASVAATAWAIDGVGGLAYLVLFLLACVPGLPLGFALFGFRHAGGWIAGLLLGYAITSLTWWAVVFAGVPSMLSFVGVWALTILVAWPVARAFRDPAVKLPAWPPRNTRLLCLLLLLVPILVFRPFARLGSVDESGNRRYRAYFIADFVWHTALTAELAREVHVR